MNKIILNNGTEAVFANYTEQIIDDYKGNPFIEALPPILSKDKVIEKLAFYPQYSENERLLSSEYRLHIVTQRLFQIFQPLSIHLELENKISTMLRNGYVSRNPLRKEYTQMILEGYKQLGNYDINMKYPRVSTASSLVIMGVSGMGKSTSIGRIFSNIPQVIVHKNYRDIKFSMYQLSWLKLDCSFDGSVKGLCIDFFTKVDNLLGTNYFSKYGTAKRTTDTLLSIICQISKNIGLGFLIVDEIQHLNLAKSGGKDKMLNFFTTLVNVVNIPIILVGTMKARNIFMSDFRLARRGLGNSGNIIWERMKKDDSFSLLVESIWDYQWTRKKTPINEEFINLLYDLSCGIIDIAVKIYCMVQIKAIVTGKEEITIELIKQVSEENLKMVKPMLNALMTNDIKKIAQYEDICTVDFEDFLSKQSKDIDFSNRIKEYTEARKQKSISIRDQAILKLFDLGVSEVEATKIIDKIIEMQGEDINLRDLVTNALSNLQEPEKKAKEKGTYDFKEDDIRAVIKAGIADNKSAYEALKEKGYIVSTNFDFCEELMI